MFNKSVYSNRVSANEMLGLFPNLKVVCCSLYQVFYFSDIKTKIMTSFIAKGNC